MRKIVKILFILGLISSVNYSENDMKIETSNNIHNVEVTKSDGSKIELSEYRGKVLLIVNVASQCMYTIHYAGLQKIYEKYRDQGFEILAFPCNDFGGQEPGTNSEISEFCSLNYNVTFELFDKIKILGNDKSQLYKILTSNEETGLGDVEWNFEKFLISKNGEIVKRFKNHVEPTDEKITKLIERELSSN